MLKRPSIFFKVGDAIVQWSLMLAGKDYERFERHVAQFRRPSKRNPVLSIEFQREKHRRLPRGIIWIHARRFEELSRQGDLDSAHPLQLSSDATLTLNYPVIPVKNRIIPAEIQRNTRPHATATPVPWSPKICATC
jgi:hypothetical protein